MWKRKTKLYDLTGLTEIEVYEVVRSGGLRSFPRYFFDCEEAKVYCLSIIRYLFEDILKWEVDDIPKKVRKETFRDNKLGGMLNALYHTSPSEVVMLAYPEKDFKPWHFVNAPNDYWRGKDGRKHGYEASMWLINDILHWSKDDIRNNLNQQIFSDNYLLGMFKIIYHSSLYEWVEAIYPKEFQPWEIGEHVANDFWDVDKGIKATKWLIMTKLKWKKEDVIEKYDKQVFVDNGLYGMIQRCFNTSPYLALNSAFPGRYNPWELKMCPIGYWNLENGIIATKWLIEKRLKWKDHDIRAKLSGVTFKQNGLYTLVEKFTPYELVNSVYPERNYKPWELRATTPVGFWNEENSIWATKWLVEEKLNFTVDEAKKLSKGVFIHYGISGVFYWFKGSVARLIDYVYDK
jgi:hypothetical protein